MSSRFGAANPSRSKNARLKIMFVCLSFFFLLLLVALFWVLQNAGTGQASTTAPVQQQVVQVDSNTVGVLMPQFRIERGTQITADKIDQLFRVEQFPKDRVPLGAITDTQRYLVLEKFAKNLISPNEPVVLEDFAASKPIDLIDIPTGYRLITILVDNRSGVEGFAKQGSRVDVIFTYEQQIGAQRQRKVTTIAKFVKVVSVAGNAQINDKGERVQIADKEVTVSLLVTQEQAQKIELARSAGELSLVLVGKTAIDPSDDGPTNITTIDDLFGDNNPPQEVEAVPADGTMYVDNKKYELRNGKWKLVLED